MKVLALIPARGGSKRLPGKNIKTLGGLPLIAWTIYSALNSECCCDVLVSTDDKEIAKVAREHGANVPWLRPEVLANDTADSVGMALHAVDAYTSEYGNVDALILLQPTSPFRSKSSIQRAIAMYTDYGAKYPIVGVSPASAHPAWTFRLSDNGMEPYLGWGEIEKRSQDLEPAWMLNGSIFLTSPERLHNERSFITVDSRPLLMDKPGEDLDIDTQADFEYCEFMLQRVIKSGLD